MIFLMVWTPGYGSKDIDVCGGLFHLCRNFNLDTCCGLCDAVTLRVRLAVLGVLG